MYKQLLSGVVCHQTLYDVNKGPHVLTYLHKISSLNHNALFIDMFLLLQVVFSSAVYPWV